MAGCACLSLLTPLWLRVPSVGLVLEMELSGRRGRCLSVTPQKSAQRSRIGGDPQVEQEGREGREGRGASRRRNHGVTVLSERRASARSTLNVAIFQGTTIHVRGERWSP